MPLADLYTTAKLPAHITTGAIRTMHATVAVYVSTPPADSQAHSSKSKPTLLLIHGNSTSSLIWRDVFASPLSKTHTIVAFDLPGHGSSGDADAELGYRNVYTQRAYARVALKVLADVVGGGDVVVLGWSLGGHVGIEMCDLLAGEEAASEPHISIKALCIVGSPPVPTGRIDLGFLPSGSVSFAGKADLTEEEQDTFAHNMTHGTYEPWMLDCVRRTDGRAREVMFETFGDGTGTCDQKACIEALTRGSDTIVAVINGAHEPAVNIKYIREDVEWGPGLWRGKCFEIEGSAEVPGGHAPFWEDWEAFWPLLRDLMADAEGAGGSDGSVK